MDAGNYAYFRDNRLTGEESVYTLWEAYQSLSDSIFDRFSGRKYKIDTTDGGWNQYIERLTNFLALAYFPQKQLRFLTLEYCAQSR
jgi:hypothetical protein